MVAYFPYLLLLITIVGLTMLANLLRIAYPILLVFGGLGLAGAYPPLPYQEWTAPTLLRTADRLRRREMGEPKRISRLANVLMDKLFIPERVYI